MDIALNSAMKFQENGVAKKTPKVIETAKHSFNVQQAMKTAPRIHRYIRVRSFPCMTYLKLCACKAVSFLDAANTKS